MTVDPKILARAFVYQDPCGCGAEHYYLKEMIFGDEQSDVIFCGSCKDWWEVDSDLPRCWCGGMASYREDASGGVIKCSKCGMIRKLYEEKA